MCASIPNQHNCNLGNKKKSMSLLQFTTTSYEADKINAILRQWKRQRSEMTVIMVTILKVKCGIEGIDKMEK